MKKLLIFQPSIGSYRVDFYNLLASRFRVEIYVEYLQSAFEIYDASSVASALEVKPHVLPKGIRLGGRQLYRGYWKAIREFRPDIVLVSEFGLDAVAAVLYRKLHRGKFRIVSMCDDSYRMLADGWDFSAFHKYMRKVVVPLIDGLILVEPDAAAWYRQHYGKGYSFPIISDEKKCAAAYEKALPVAREYISRYGLDGKCVFLYVGRLIDIKNVGTLVEAFIEAALPDARLVVVGDGDRSDSLRELAEGHPDVIFTGRLSGAALYAWYDIADALVLPSLVEPFGAVTNEALNGGCRVLVSDRAGSRCLVREGVNGHTFDPADKASLIEKMKQIDSSARPGGPRAVAVRPSLMPERFGELTAGVVDFLENI